MKRLKLSIELVPSTCWFSNVRSHVSKDQWKAIQQQVCSQAWDTCEICGGIGEEHPVECHEIWFYNDHTQTQKLIGMIALCPDCHGVKHLGFSHVRGKGEQAIKHFMKVNKLTKREAEEHIHKVFEVWNKRSQHDWTLDISYLEGYGIDTSKIGKK